MWGRSSPVCGMEIILNPESTTVHDISSKDVTTICTRGRIDEKMRVRVVVLLVFSVLAYMVAGGFIFNALERGHERQTRQHARDFLNQFLENHPCVSSEDMDALVTSVITAYDSGIIAVNNATAFSTTWDVPNSIFFAATVITTIGYGHLAPKTTGGRAFTIPFALLGIPVCLVMLAGIGSQFNDIADKLEKRIPMCNRRSKTGKVVRVLTLILVGTVLFLLLPALSFMITEEWGYGEAIYYCFVTLTTIGFGDFVAGVNSQKEYSHLYRLARTLWLFLGLAWLSTVIAAKQNTIQELINKEEQKYKSQERQKALVKMSEDNSQVVESERNSGNSHCHNRTRLKLDTGDVSPERRSSVEGSSDSPAEHTSLLPGHPTTHTGAAPYHTHYGSTEQLHAPTALNLSLEPNANGSSAFNLKNNTQTSNDT